jgi:FkbM family methyltransferase
MQQKQELKQIGKRLLRAINKPLGLLGVEFTRRGANPMAYDRLQRIQKLGVRPTVIFDCGAYIGGWTAEVATIFPGAQFVLFEPNTTVTPKTKATIASIQPTPILIEAAVGEQTGTGYLNVWNNTHTSDQGSSMLGHVQSDAQTKLETPIVSLDSVVAERGLRPDLIKLDLQGYELTALKGATDVLRTAEVVITEFGVGEAYLNSTTPLQLIQFMHDHDFVLYDIVDLLYRPYDKALSSGDFFFVKRTSKLLAYKGYT